MVEHSVSYVDDLNESQRKLSGFSGIAEDTDISWGEFCELETRPELSHTYTTPSKVIDVVYSYLVLM